MSDAWSKIAAILSGFWDFIKSVGPIVGSYMKGQNDALAEIDRTATKKTLEQVEQTVADNKAIDAADADQLDRMWDEFEKRGSRPSERGKG